ncbi:hypothetical protein CS063_11750 [Sporanaerobium hydrogeniformans]|uniref:Uncharacterized protein n=1 Tax=Sporanaerobium hydrogeniformans TaxID=3072179 RepID=A0AC61DA38_9FIRM|nr:stalk domain-containing protein [Sporanaerobium hydrogeniformans]PHV70144.1 hypothetical protein CS063_11750 [Sporanaerobium hydrogeniformans]
MKLRQKLAAVLAATMVATAMPVMAKSDFALTNGITIAKKDETINNGKLRITMKDAVTTSAMFFVNLENAEWNVPTTSTNATSTSGTALTNVTVQYKKNNKNEVEVTVTKPVGGTGMEEFVIPLDVKLTGGDATVAVDGNGTVISDMAPVVFAKTTDSKAAVTAADSKNIYKTGVVADVTIEETIAGSIGTNTITVSLDNTDYEFVGLTAGNLKFSKGFSSFTTSNVTLKQDGATVTSVTDDEFTFTLSGAAQNAPGRVVIEGAKVRLKSGKTVNPGDEIAVTVEGEGVTTTTVKVAEAKELGSSLEMKDKKVVDMVAGKDQKITFTLKENVDDSILDNRTIEVRLNQGFLANTEVTGSNLTSGTAVNAIKNAIKVNDGTAGADVTAFTLVTDKDDRVIGFDFAVAAGELEADKNDEIKFEDVKVYMPVDKTGDVVISAEGRALGQTVEVTALNVTAPVEVTSEEFTLKVGLKDQKGGKLVITETDKGRLKQGENLVIAIDKKDDGFVFTGKPVVKVTEGDLKLDLDKMDYTDGTIIIPVSRASKTASTITITEMPIKVDRTVPEGKYDLKLTGAAVQPGCIFGSVKVEDFINVGTPNTQDLSANGLRKGKTSFVIGSNKYLVNGIELEMDAAAYLDPAGRTMVPLRFVANALGIDDKEIYFASNTATIVAGSKTISLEIGSKTAKLNGVAVRTMDVAPVLKNERTYVPVGEIASLLGVDAKWDGETQTATFINE